MAAGTDLSYVLASDASPQVTLVKIIFGIYPKVSKPRVDVKIIRLWTFCVRTRGDERFTALLNRPTVIAFVIDSEGVPQCFGELGGTVCTASRPAASHSFINVKKPWG